VPSKQAKQGCGSLSKHWLGAWFGVRCCKVDKQGCQANKLSKQAKVRCLVLSPVWC